MFVFTIIFVGKISKNIEHTRVALYISSVDSFLVSDLAIDSTCSLLYMGHFGTNVFAIHFSRELCILFIGGEYQVGTRSICTFMCKNEYKENLKIHEYF